MPLKSFGCKICGKQAPKKYLAHSKFKERMKWLRKHRQKYHPEAHRRSVAKRQRTS